MCMLILIGFDVIDIIRIVFEKILISYSGYSRKTVYPDRCT